MRFLFNLLMFFLVALLVGFGLSYYALEKGRLFGTVNIGPWTAWPDVGSPTPDPYTRAFISRENVLVLARAEGIRFVADTDSDGQELLRECSYRVDGETPEATFWTLAATHKSGKAVTAPHAAMALNSSRLVRAEDGAFAIFAGPVLSGGNWMEIQGTGPYQLVLTLYDTSIFDGFSSTDNVLPSIIREGCP